MFKENNVCGSSLSSSLRPRDHWGALDTPNASDSGEGETAIPRARDPGTENGRFSIPARGLPGLEADLGDGNLADRLE